MTTLHSKAVVRQVNKGNSRHYEVDGVPELRDVKLSSVTTILGVINKPALVPWAKKVSLEKVRSIMYDAIDLGGGLVAQTKTQVDAMLEQSSKMPDDILSAAGDIGTRVHSAIEALIADPKADVHVIGGDVAQAVENFLSWQKQSGLDITLSEKLVYSLEHRYAGTMDAGAYRGNRFVALDWKSSNGLYPEAAYQVSAYAKAWEEMTGEKAEEAWVVRVGKNKAEFEAKQIKDIDACFATFLAAKDLYNGMKEKAWV